MSMDFFKNAYKAKQEIDAVIIGEKIRIDYLGIVDSQAYPPKEYCYALITGFTGNRYNIQMLQGDWNDKRLNDLTRYAPKHICSTPSRLEELLYF